MPQPTPGTAPTINRLAKLDQSPESIFRTTLLERGIAWRDTPLKASLLRKDAVFDSNSRLDLVHGMLDVVERPFHVLLELVPLFLR
jgi:hypothetical protein